LFALFRTVHRDHRPPPRNGAAPIGDHDDLRWMRAREIDGCIASTWAAYAPEKFFRSVEQSRLPPRIA